MCSLHCHTFKTDFRGEIGTVHCFTVNVFEKWAGCLNKIAHLVTRVQICRRKTPHSYQDNFCLALPNPTHSGLAAPKVEVSHLLLYLAHLHTCLEAMQLLVWLSFL